MQDEPLGSLCTLLLIFPFLENEDSHGGSGQLHTKGMLAAPDSWSYYGLGSIFGI